MFSERFVLTVWVCVLVLSLFRVLQAGAAPKEFPRPVVVICDAGHPGVSENHYEELGDSALDQCQE